MLWNGYACGRNLRNENFKTTLLSTGYVRSKTTVEIGIFNYFCSVITNDVRCTRETKPRIVIVKESFNKKKTLFTSKLDLNFRKK
jgi:hypothetical protein